MARYSQPAPPSGEDIEYEEAAQTRVSLEKKQEEEAEAEIVNRNIERQASDEYARLKGRQAARERVLKEAEERLTSEEGKEKYAGTFTGNVMQRMSQLDDPKELIKGHLALDSLARTVGAPKSLKSFVTLDMAASVSLGIPWCGHETKRSRVLYIVAEGLRGMKYRQASWEAHKGLEMSVEFYTLPLQIGDEEQMRSLIAYSTIPDQEGRKVEYIIFDTQARCTLGVDENDNTEMGRIVGALGVLQRKTGACIHLVHHTAKNSATSGRGAGAIDGAIDTGLIVTREGGEEENGCTVSTQFQKDMDHADDVELTVKPVGSSIVLTAPGEVAASGAVVAEAPGGWETRMLKYVNIIAEHDALGITNARLASELGENSGTTSRELSRLKNAAMVEIKSGKIKITKKARQGIAYERMRTIGD